MWGLFRPYFQTKLLTKKDSGLPNNQCLDYHSCIMKENTHKKWIKDTFDASSDKYGTLGPKIFEHFGSLLVENAPLKKGDRILDVATGRGAVLIPASKKVGQKGHVCGIDISPGMLSSLQTSHLPSHVELREMDAETLDFPDASFDHIFCSFALYFFPNLPKTLEEIKRILTPGGTLSVSIWGPAPPIDREMGKIGLEIAPLQELDAFNIVGSNHLTELLQNAGFHNVKISKKQKTVYHQSSTDWWDHLKANGWLSCADHFTSHQLELLKKHSLSMTKNYETDQGIQEEFTAYFGTAQKSIQLKQVEIETPIGEMTAIGDETALFLLEFSDRPGLNREIEQLKKSTNANVEAGRTPPLNTIEKELHQYFDTGVWSFETPYRMTGTPFQQKVWEELRRIPSGKTLSYLELAKAVGKPTGARAVAQANSSNKLAIIIPCHRVINSNGNIGGYAGGTHRKQWMLERES